MTDRRESGSEEKTTEQVKPAATVYYLDEWRARRPTLRRGGRRGRRADKHKSRGPGGYGYGSNFYDYGYYGGYGYGSHRGAYGGYGNYYGRRRGDTVRSGYGYTYGGWDASARPHQQSTKQSRRSRVTKLPGAHDAIVRRRLLAVGLFAVCIAVAAALLLRTLAAREWGPLADPPPILHVWIAATPAADHDWTELLDEFSESYGIDVHWDVSAADDYELLYKMLFGPAPDVVIVDPDAGAHLLAIDAFIELNTGPTTFSSAWAAIPRQARRPDLGRQFVAYLSDAAAVYSPGSTDGR